MIVPPLQQLSAFSYQLSAKPDKGLQVPYFLVWLSADR